MKTVKSFAKIIIALLMALTLVTLTACDVLDDFFGKGGEEGGKGDGNVYQVTLETNGGTFTESLIEEYTSGTACTLPTDGTKEHYTFDGWYSDSSFSGNKVLQIPTGATGDKTYYAKWDPDTYTITYNISGEGSTQDTYTYNEAKTLSTPSKSGYTFNGWYSDANLTGSKVTQIPAGEYGIKTFYGEWKSGGSSASTYNVTLNKNGGTTKTELTQYTEGVGAALPEMEARSGYSFEGWFDNAGCTGTAVTSIPSDATGDKTYWAKWTPVSVDGINITAYGGYEEGAYVELALDSSVSLDNVTVSYNSNNLGSKTLSGDNKNLVRRIADNKVRADIVGIEEGTCQITVSANGKSATKTVNVSAYDRSGYAHFDSSTSDKLYANGVGGYNNDGTPKSGAEIIYVTEATKNSVTASYLKNSDGVGLVAVLKNANRSSKPVIVRIIGRIAAATWDKSNWETLKAKYNNATKDEKGKIKNDSSIVGINNKQLPTSSNSLTQQALIDGGYNKLQTDITELNGLVSKVTYSSDSVSGYDSYWNNCEISEASNITVEGIGTDAMIFQWGLTWKKCSSIEVRNITFDDYTEDACSFEGSDTSLSNVSTERFWVHNNTFEQGKNYWDVCAEQDKREGDGATDFKRCANITIAYNHYHENHKTGLIGSDNKVFTANVTFHHNYYDTCSSRLPLSRQANMHMYNNYYHNTTGTSISLRAYAYAFIEYCYFDGSNNTMIDIQSVDSNTTKSYGVAKLYNCQMSGKGYSYQSMPTSEKPSDNQIHATFIKVVNDRTATVTNYNKIISGQFDLDSKSFYATGSKSNVANLIEDLAKVKSNIPTLAGVHKN